METISARFRIFYDSLGISALGFDNKVGLSRGLTGKILSGVTLSQETCEKIFSAFPDLNANWLFKGEGMMYDRLEKVDELTMVDQKPGRFVLPPVITVDKSGKENILMVGSKAFAGYTTNHQEAEYLRKLPAFGMPLPEFRNATFRAFQASGSSMEPTIWNGDWLIGQFVDDWDRSIQDGRIYIVVTRETILVKRVLNRMATGKIVIQSDNEVFPTDFINIEDVRELWYLKAKVSFQFPNTRYEVARRVANLEADLEEIKRKLMEEE